MGQALIEQQAYDVDPRSDQGKGKENLPVEPVVVDPKANALMTKEKEIDAEIAKEQTAENEPIHVAPVIFDENVSGRDKQHMTQLTKKEGTTSVRPMTASERLQEFYKSVRPVKPVYDPNRVEEINRLKKMNSIGEGLKVLGDVFALAKGANLNKREPNTKNDRLTQAALDYMDRYNQLMTDWNYKDYAAKMKGAETAAADEWRNKAMKQQQDNADRNYNFNYRKYYDDKKRQQDKDKATDDYRKDALKMRQDELDWRKKAPEVDYELWKKKKDYAIELAGKEAKENDENYVLYDKTGKRYSLDKNEEQKIAALILQNDNIEKGDIDLLKAAFNGSGAREQTGQLIQKYWEQMSNVQNYMGKYGYSVPQPQPQQTEQKPQYSTGGYY